MSNQPQGTATSLQISTARFRLYAEINSIMNSPEISMYMRAACAEWALAQLRDNRGEMMAYWADAYGMAIHRAEQTDDMARQHAIMDRFYQPFLSALFNSSQGRMLMNRLWLDGNQLAWAEFKKDNGSIYLCFLHLKTATYVYPDHRTAQLISSEEGGFTMTELKALRDALAHLTHSLPYRKPRAFDELPITESAIKAKPAPPPPQSIEENSAGIFAFLRRLFSPGEKAA